MRYLSLCVVILLVFVTDTVTANDLAGDKFYGAFRDSVLNLDKKMIVAMTRFPFEVRGTDDSQDVKSFNQRKFLLVLDELLAQKEYVVINGQVVEVTMYQMIKERRRLLPKDYLTPEFVRVGDFEFQRSKGQWRFTGAYLD